MEVEVDSDEKAVIRVEEQGHRHLNDPASLDVHFTTVELHFDRIFDAFEANY